jgi:protein-S-isoprenylcysteine O-methyltransferase Ste14
MISSIVIVVGSLSIVWLSRRSLLHPASHGFSRFFAFEAILALVVLNAPLWFVHPFSVQQIASWLLLFASVVLAVWGVVLLRRFGGSRRTIKGAPIFEWESTDSLVTTGIYRYVRHPMYWFGHEYQDYMKRTRRFVPFVL